MMNTVEHGGFHSGIMYHVLKDDELTYLQRMIEAPVAYEIATEAGVASHAIDVGPFFAKCGASNHGLVRHLQTVGHVASKADVKDSGLDPTVFYDIHHLGREHSRLPSKSRSRLQDDVQIRIALVKSSQQTYQVGHIIILARHQMATTEVQPLQFRKPVSELLFQVLQRMLQCVGGGFSVAMAMEALDAFRQFFRQLLCQEAETCPWSAGIVKVGLYLRVLRIDAHTA